MHIPLLWPAAGAAHLSHPSSPVRNSPSKGKEAKWTRKKQRFKQQKTTTKQPNRKKRSSIWLSAYLFFQRACLLARNKKEPPANLEQFKYCSHFCCFLFALCFVFFIFFLRMDTGKRSSIMPTVEEWRKAKNWVLNDSLSLLWMLACQIRVHCLPAQSFKEKCLMEKLDH